MKYIQIFLFTAAVFAFTTQPVFAKQLSVPFTPQAPEANWDQPWQDACEEATIVMINSFYHNEPLFTAKAKKDILQILDVKQRLFGYSLDENVSKITTIINNYLPWEATIVRNPTIAQLKQEIDEGRPVLIPSHGQSLFNPHFKNGGPDYHTLVLSGYDDTSQEFITQEPGTIYGENYRYTYDVLMESIHDFTTRGDTINGDRVVIFTSPVLTFSADIDADNDGLTKAQEMEHSTVPWLWDSDGDGYSDGQEVANGYSPTRPLYVPNDGELIKATDSPKVYLIENKKRRHIISEAVFLKRGFAWEDILVLPPGEVNQIVIGNAVK